MVMFCHASLAAVVLLQPVLVEVVMVETGLMSSKLLVVTEEGISSNLLCSKDIGLGVTICNLFIIVLGCSLHQLIWRQLSLE